MDGVIKPTVKSWPREPAPDHVRTAPAPVEQKPSREEA